MKFHKLWENSLNGHVIIEISPIWRMLFSMVRDTRIKTLNVTFDNISVNFLKVWDASLTSVECEVTPFLSIYANVSYMTELFSFVNPRVVRKNFTYTLNSFHFFVIKIYWKELFNVSESPRRLFNGNFIANNAIKSLRS